MRCNKSLVCRSIPWDQWDSYSFWPLPWFSQILLSCEGINFGSPAFSCWLPSWEAAARHLEQLLVLQQGVWCSIGRSCFLPQGFWSGDLWLELEGERAQSWLQIESIRLFQAFSIREDIRDAKHLPAGEIPFPLSHSKWHSPLEVWKSWKQPSFRSCLCMVQLIQALTGSLWHSESYFKILQLSQTGQNECFSRGG